MKPVDWWVRQFVFWNMVFLVFFSFLLFNTAKLNAWNGPPPLASMVVPVQNDEGESGDEAKFTFCFYGW